MNTTTIRRAACALMLAGTLALLTGCVSQMTERPAQDISPIGVFRAVAGRGDGTSAQGGCGGGEESRVAVFL